MKTLVATILLYLMFGWLGIMIMLAWSALYIVYWFILLLFAWGDPKPDYEIYKRRR